MIDLKDLRTNPDKYRRGAANKQVNVGIDALLSLDADLRQAMTRQQELTAEKNQIGKQIGQIAGKLKKAGDNERADLQQQMKQLQQRPAAIKEEEAKLAEQVHQLEQQRDALWLQVPQPADEDVPVGTSADDNVELRTWKSDWFDPAKSFADNKGFEPKSHTELGEALGLFDFERGVKMAGSRSYVLTGDGMRLHNAVLQFAFNFMVQDHGFTPMSVPVLVRDQVMVGTGFFPGGKDQAYEVKETERGGGYDLYLTGTGEVGLMGYHADEILDADSLPRCYTTVSTCFRREAGAAGKDTAGLYRIHQFDKVEQVVICQADEQTSRDWHKKMIGYVEALLQALELPYRLLQCCTGDLGPKNADMIDLETWMPSRESYGETHSASRLYDYQCRRLNMRYKDPESGKNVFCHSLNNTVAASPRILIPILELYQNEDGSITVPTALRPYMGGAERIGG
ncbi:serine--tRNA ligase [Phycisphaerales bacterium AB-hyl4]|uniref:Serine--tRNA ligase n=1 Tax=Natronomicrosphaera hydrolytica TaxID=3242702 RepID=A0ABV4U0E6_9BACT